MSLAFSSDTSTSTQIPRPTRALVGSPWVLTDHRTPYVLAFANQNAHLVSPSLSGTDMFGGLGSALGLMTASAIRDRDQKTRAFLDAWMAGTTLAGEMADADEIDPPSPEIWMSAVIKLSSYIGRVTAPLIHPLQLGAVSFEWHDLGMNIELRFRSQDDVFIVIEDSRNEISKFYGNDNHFVKAREALDAFVRRQT